MKILLAADGSEYTAKAADYLVDYIRQLKEAPELHLFHVKTPIPDGLIQSMVGRSEIEAYYREESEAALANAEKVLHEKGVPFTSSYVVGNIAAKIREYVSNQNIDMVVMGSHGHGHFKKLVLGSVATAVIASTSVPVLLVR